MLRYQEGCADRRDRDGRDSAASTGRLIPHYTVFSGCHRCSKMKKNICFPLWMTFLPLTRRCLPDCACLK
jgi:hypothetical protein